MFLKPPTRSDAPKRKSPLLAFSNKKRAVIPKALPSDASLENAAAAEREASRRSDPFYVWLENLSHREAFVEAVEYLKLGAPYKGVSAFESKDALKELHAVWAPNPLKNRADGVRDGLVGGWWSAPDESVLLDILEIELSSEKRNDGAKDHDAYSDAWRDAPPVGFWQPLEVPEESVRRILELICEFRSNQKMEDASLARAAATDRAAAAARAAAVASKDVAVLDDNASDVSQLERMGVRWSRKIASEVSRRSDYGPSSGLSDAIRALRAIKLKLVSVDALNRMGGQAQPTVLVVEEASRRVVDTPHRFNNRYIFTGPSTGAFIFGSSPGMIAVPQPRALARILQEHSLADLECAGFLAKPEPVCAGRAGRGQVQAQAQGRYYTTRKFTRTICSTCKNEVDGQFLDCQCSNRWLICPLCNGIYNAPMQQACGGRGCAPPK